MKYFILLMLLISSCAKQQTAQGDKRRVAYLIAGSLGDKGYYDNGQRGIDRLKEEYNVETLTIEIGNDPSRYQASLELVTQWNPDIVFVIPHGYETLVKEYADVYTNILWVSLSIPMESPNKNLASIQFYVSQGSYLIGMLAALMTTNTAIQNINPKPIIGVIAGMKNPMMDKDFVNPFKEGALYVNSNLIVRELYTETFTDPTRGKQAAKQLNNEGADVIFQAAGLTGLGVLESASENKFYGVGVDINQNGLYPGAVVTSLLVDYGYAITTLYDKYVEGVPVRGNNFRFGVKDNTITLAIDEYTRGILPQETIDKLYEYVEEMKSGNIAQDLK